MVQRSSTILTWVAILLCLVAATLPGSRTQVCLCSFGEGLPVSHDSQGGCGCGAGTTDHHHGDGHRPCLGDHPVRPVLILQEGCREGSDAPEQGPVPVLLQVTPPAVDLPRRPGPFHRRCRSGPLISRLLEPVVLLI